ncbi:hypothetical protein E4H12_13595 [Candidatus Thorarchaeota archaeon]|nr:MAG: hypothetical protein E4H12_13595 [Candidatus Thorarchaeota archaeon]
MVRKSKKGAYEHFCVLLYGQGQWSEADRQSVVAPILKIVKTYTPDPYPFFLKLNPVGESFQPGGCAICTPIHTLFQELKGQADGILYLGHHYIIPEDDLEDMASFVKMVLDNDLVKKMYILYIDGFGDIKKTELAQWDLETLKTHIETQTVTRSDFLTTLSDGRFNNRVIYEIVKW